MKKQYELKTIDNLDDRQFRLAVRRLADSLSYGADKSPYVGSGIEYAQSRPYEPGDSVKAMDWRVTARTGKYYVKEYETPKRMPVYILVDTSASMCVTSQRLSKYAWAVQLATGLALAAQRRLSPVGVIAVGDRDLHVQPTLSHGIVFQWAHKLRYYHVTEQTRLEGRIRELAPTLENRCMVLVLSDLHDLGAVGALKLMAQKHDTVVLRLLDPAEQGRLRSGLMRGREAETGRAFTAHGSSCWLDVEGGEHELNKGGVDHMLLPTNESFVPKLRNFLDHRENFGRGAR